MGGDDFCDHEITTYNTYSRGFDGGDCLELNKYPNCDVNNPGWIGNGICDRDKDGYNTEEESCGFD